MFHRRLDNEIRFWDSRLEVSPERFMPLDQQSAQLLQIARR
jgi:hypothetical protein